MITSKFAAALATDPTLAATFGDASTTVTSFKLKSDCGSQLIGNPVAELSVELLPVAIPALKLPLLLRFCCSGNSLLVARCTVRGGGTSRTADHELWLTWLRRSLEPGRAR